MNISELKSQINTLYNSIEDDEEFLSAEYETVVDYCIEKKFLLSHEEDMYLQSLGYHYEDFYEYYAEQAS